MNIGRGKKNFSLPLPFLLFLVSCWVFHLPASPFSLKIDLLNQLNLTSWTILA